jgi:hypothetical protein
VSEFCRKHRSHFCPCAMPSLYEGRPAYARAWDDPELAKKLWKGRRDDEALEELTSADDEEEALW